MRSMILSFVMVCFVVAVQAGSMCPGVAIHMPDEQKGYKYASAEGKVKVSFPGEYVEEAQSKDYGKSTTVKCVVGEEVYMLNFVIHSEYLGGSDPVELANTALETFSKEIGGTTKRTFDYKYKKHLGKGAEVDLSGSLVTYRCIIIGQIQYQLVTITSPKNAGVAQEFVDSFKSFAK